MRILVAVLASFPMIAWADGFKTLDNAGIVATLTDQKLRYSDAWQEFFLSGRTLYNGGRDSWGYWRAEGGQYCSQWPPSDVWACYDVQTDRTVIRFVGAGGTPMDGRVDP